MNKTHKPQQQRAKCSVHYVIENEQKALAEGKPPTPGLSKWLSNTALMDTMVNNPCFRSFSSHTKLKKEMTEASTQLEMVEQLCKEYNLLLDSSNTDVLIVDVGCGKGYFGILAYYSLVSKNASKFKYLLLDKNEKMNLSHIFDKNSPIDSSKLKFEFVDIRAFNFSLSKYIRNKCNEFSNNGKTNDSISINNNNNNKTESKQEEKTTGSKENSSENSANFSKTSASTMKVILVGTHLCGELSNIVIDAFKELDDICIGLLLVPCCFPKQPNASKKQRKKELKKLKLKQEKKQKKQKARLKNGINIKNIIDNATFSNKDEQVGIIETVRTVESKTDDVIAIDNKSNDMKNSKDNYKSGNDKINIAIGNKKNDNKYNKYNRKDWNIMQNAKLVNMKPFEYWLHLLQNRLRKSGKNDSGNDNNNNNNNNDDVPTIVTCEKMDSMLSEKNWLIKSVRSSLIQSHSLNSKTLQEQQVNDHDDAAQEPPFKRQRIQ